MAKKTVRPPEPQTDLSALTDRELTELMYRELRADLASLHELAENHAVAIAQVRDAHELTARRVDALITDRRALDTEVKQTKVELRLARERVIQLERDVEPIKRARAPRR